MAQAHAIDSRVPCDVPARLERGSWARDLARSWWSLLVASGVGRGPAR
jgi:hypothetical protein